MRFMRVRHCGLFANASAARNLALARAFLGVPTPAPPPPPPPDPTPLDPTIDPLTLRAPFCPDCRTVAMQWIYECAPLVHWIKKRYGFFAARAKGAGFGAKAKSSASSATSASSTSAAATGPARPTPCCAPRISSA